ncbi:DUF6233 domain-containing protein [Streptomyces xiamenensis]|uniref:DUF6233 domain-containing protein n=1 Tax=Streptomyces xiamenensis TaxID=408015 RepID=UPI0036E898EA
MNDLPADLPRLHVIRTWLDLQLQTVDEAIRAAEQQAEEDAAAPGWWVQWRRRRIGRPRTGVLHRTGCWLPGTPDLTATELVAALAEHGDRIETCPVCQPDRPEA